MRKMVVILLVAVLVAGGGYYLKGKRENSSGDAPTLITVTVERGPIFSSISTTGRVVPNLEVEIKCKASGEIVRLPYDISDYVKKGDLLVELDPVDEQRAVKRAEVALSASQAKRVQAQRNLRLAGENLDSERKRAASALRSAEAGAQDAEAKSERVKHLLEKKLASQEEYDTAKTATVQAASTLENVRVRIEELETEELALELKRQDVHLAEAQVESDQITLLDAKQRLEDTKVMAPIDGIISASNVQVGQIISSGISNVGGGTTMLTLADLSRMFILASVDESDIGSVKVDQPTEITADAFPGTRFRGRVVRVATKGVSASNVVTFEAKIEVLGKNKSLLKSEMTANLEIIAAQEEDVLFVPVEAVQRRGKQKIVLVSKKDGQTEERPVETGIDDGINVEITSGLSEGETVIVNKEQADSRWRNSDARQSARGQRMMMRGMRGR